MNYSIPVLALVWACGPALAQPDATKKADRAARRARVAASAGPSFSLLALTPGLEQRLGITPEQKAKFAEIESRLQQSLKNQPAGEQSPEARREAVNRFLDLRNRADGEAEALLTAPQKAALAAIRTDAELFQGLGRYTPALLAIPDLSGEQRTRLQAIVAAHRQSQARAIRETQGANRRGLPAQFQAQQAQLEAALRTVLTAPQAGVFEANLPRTGFRGSRPQTP